MKSNFDQIDHAELARVIGGSSSAAKEAVMETVGRLSSLANTVEQQKRAAATETSNMVVQNLLGRATALPSTQQAPTSQIPTQPRIA